MHHWSAEPPFSCGVCRGSSAPICLSLNHQAENLGSAASCCCVQLGAVLPLGRQSQSKDGYVRLVGEQCAIEPQQQPFPVPDYTRGAVNISLLRATIFRQCLNSILFHVRQGSVFPSGRRQLAALRTTPHSIIPKPFFSSTFFLASVVTRDPDAIVDELVEDGVSFSAALRANSELAHCCCENCNLAFTECQETSRDIFPQTFSHLDTTTPSCSYATRSFGMSGVSCAEKSLSPALVLFWSGMPVNDGGQSLKLLKVTTLKCSD